MLDLVGHRSVASLSAFRFDARPYVLVGQKGAGEEQTDPQRRLLFSWLHYVKKNHYSVFCTSFYIPVKENSPVPLKIVPIKIFRD